MATELFTAIKGGDKTTVERLLEPAAEHAHEGFARRHPPMEPRPAVPW